MSIINYSMLQSGKSITKDAYQILENSSDFRRSLRKIYSVPDLQVKYDTFSPVIYFQGTFDNIRHFSNCQLLIYSLQSFGVYISKLISYARLCSHTYTDAFNNDVPLTILKHSHTMTGIVIKCVSVTTYERHVFMVLDFKRSKYCADLKHVLNLSYLFSLHFFSKSDDFHRGYTYIARDA